jgi:hypothetical protein
MPRRLKVSQIVKLRTLTGARAPAPRRMLPVATTVNQGGARPANPELVFVIHGRQLRDEFHHFLGSLHLKPLEWSEARKRTGKPNPYTWEIVDLALKEAGAIVALLTPDDEARLAKHLWSAQENAIEKTSLAATPECAIRSGSNFYGGAPGRTVLIRVGRALAFPF